MISIMPCHDKKLETFRPESTIAGQIKALDIVIATTELEDYVREKKDEVFAYALSPDTKTCWQVDEMIAQRISEGKPLEKTAFLKQAGYGIQDHPLYSSSEISTTSNNFLNQILIKGYLNRTGKLIKETEIVETLRRNKKGFGEVLLQDSEHQLKFSAARVYGFKNIQNLIRQMKTSQQNTYNYIELMACPGGCYTGGGQVKSKEHNLDALQDTYEQIRKQHTQRRYFFENKTACQLAGVILQGNCQFMSKAALEYNIKPVVQSDNPVFMKW